MRPTIAALGMAFLLAAAGPGAAQENRALQLQIDGLACPICARTLEYRLGALDGVAEATVDFRSGQGLLVLKDGAEIDAAGLAALIEAYGFRLLAVEAIEPAD